MTAAVLGLIRVATLAGESQRGNTTFFASTAKRPRESTDLQRLQTNSYISQKTLHCRFGPTDKSNAVPVNSLLPKALRPPNTRIGKVERGLSCKRGCLMQITASQLALWPEITHIVGKHFDHVNAAGVYCHGCETELPARKKHKHASASQAAHGAAQDGNAGATAAANSTVDPATVASHTATAAAATTAASATTAAAAATASPAPVPTTNTQTEQVLVTCSNIIDSCNGDQKLLDLLASYLRHAQNTIDGIKARNSLGKARPAAAAAQKADVTHDSIAQLAATLTHRQAAASRGTACPAAQGDNTQLAMSRVHTSSSPIEGARQNMPVSSTACQAAAVLASHQQNGLPPATAELPQAASLAGSRLCTAQAPEPSHKQH